MADNTSSGLNIKKGEECSENAFDWAKTTFSNRPQKKGSVIAPDKKSYASLLSFGNQKIGITSDGIGTKIEIAERLHKYDTLGFDLVAMVVDDLSSIGVEPTSISNILDVNRLQQPIINSLMQGLATACDTTNVSITGGEIAELGSRVNGYGNQMHFNWSATAIGALPPQLKYPIEGTQIKTGQVVVALQSNGFRSNGFSLLRQLMYEHLGEKWHQVNYQKGKTWGEELLTPSKIYTPFIQALIQSNTIPTGITHITGGGIFKNFSRILKFNQLGANLDGLFAPHHAMLNLMKIGNLSFEDAYLYWNMGNGMLIVVEPEELENVTRLAQKMDYKAQKAGVIIDKPKITIKNNYTTLIQQY